MSRSFKKNPAGGLTKAKSDKKDKRIANRSLRKKVNQIDLENQDPLLIKENSNVWDFDKDGKKYYSHLPEKEMRK